MRTNTASRLSSALLVLLIAPGCATLIQKRTQSIPVTSTPPGATVSVNGQPQGRTPLELRLARKGKDQVIRIESPGYDPVEIRPRRKLAGHFVLGNALVGVAVGLVPTFFWMLRNDDVPTHGTPYLIWSASAAAVGAQAREKAGGPGVGEDGDAEGEDAPRLPVVDPERERAAAVAQVLARLFDTGQDIVHRKPLADDPGRSDENILLKPGGLTDERGWSGAGGLALLGASAVPASPDPDASAPRKTSPTVRGAFLYPPSERLKEEGYWSWPGSSFDAEGRIAEVRLQAQGRAP
mgnify:CR=1 FL=1